MARKSFLLRIDESVLEAMKCWADDDLRSLNTQIEYVLRDALKKAKREIRKHPPPRESGEAADEL